MNVPAFLATTLIAATVALAPTFAPDWLAEAVRLTAAASDDDPRCGDADRAAVARLQPLLERTTETDGYVVDRALHALDIARTQCHTGSVEIALGQYGLLDRWIATHQ